MTEGEAPNAMARLAESAQVIVFIVGVFYAVGLVIVNVDLSLYGIVHLDLARPEYVMAGALWVVVVLGPIVASLVGLVNARGFINASQRSFKGLSAAVVTTVLAGFAFPVLVMLSLSSRDEGAALSLGVRYLVLVAAVTATATLVFPLVIYGGRTFSITPDWRFRSVATIPAVSGAVVILAVMIWLYVAYAFPYMNRAFGGGRKPVVQIALRQAAPLSWTFTGMPISSDGASVGPVLLVVERSDAVVVSPIPTSDPPWYGPRRPASTTAIARELIAAVHYTSRAGWATQKR